MRWMLVLIVLLAVAWKYWPEPEPVPVEETFIGDQIKAHNRAKDFNDEYLKATEDRQKRMEEEIEKSSGG